MGAAEHIELAKFLFVQLARKCDLIQEEATLIPFLPLLPISMCIRARVAQSIARGTANSKLPIPVQIPTFVVGGFDSQIPSGSVQWRLSMH